MQQVQDELKEEKGSSVVAQRECSFHSKASKRKGRGGAKRTSTLGPGACGVGAQASEEQSHHWLRLVPLSGSEDTGSQSVESHSRLEPTFAARATPPHCLTLWEHVNRKKRALLSFSHFLVSLYCLCWKILKESPLGKGVLKM